ncbi:Hypothetical predicted protein [Marmota monax]|uniref:Uncharacterized protein n=1 Tax=Marmota monax TaxID=9995 RepID=A0A5E4CEP3_MARMO|nr:Hypothetical predicted protein [Marmota monax]
MRWLCPLPYSRTSPGTQRLRNKVQSNGRTCRAPRPSQAGGASPPLAHVETRGGTSAVACGHRGRQARGGMCCAVRAAKETPGVTAKAALRELSPKKTAWLESERGHPRRGERLDRSLALSVASLGSGLQWREGLQRRHRASGREKATSLRARSPGGLLP